ncbi:CMRF35-like molecule 8 [Oncorhynchus masou masou]|uniref:CMRF35-like molecule 8 n=1 Tax=Oncorhynchus masou masou TaxID=90313 RepID=UPI003183FD0E
MRILLIVILLSFMTGCLSSFKVTGSSGGTVIISCHYSTEDRSRDKYFCSGQHSYSLSCKDQIRTGLKNTWKHSGRFSLYDNTGGNYFKVIIRQLTRPDEGTYWCGVDIPTAPDSYTKVELEVKKDDCCEKSVTETAFLGGEATIRCNYPEDHEDDIKYFCKESNDFKTCVYMVPAHQTTAEAGRFSVSDNSTERFSTVTISDLTEDDTGTYWCGVETNRTEQRYITLITQVKLLVIMKPTNTTTTTAPPDPPTTTFLSPSSSSSSSSSLNRSGTSVVIMVSVSLVVLLLLISLILVYRWKYNKVTGSVSSTHRVSPDTVNNDGGCHGDGDYEEIMERPLQSDSDAATSTIYATANLPTSYSDSPHYASVNFHKNPSSPNEATATITEEGSCPNEDIAAITEEGTSSCDYDNVNCQSPTYSTVNHPHCSSEAPPISSTGSIPIDT